MTLRNYIILVLASSLTLLTSYGQIKQDKRTIVTQIKNIFKQINNYKNYKVVTIDNSEEFTGHATDNSGSLKGYYKGDSLKKIVEWLGLSNRVVQNEYYFDKGKLVFVYSENKRFKFNDSTGEFDYSKFDKTFTSRYYFNNDELFETVISDKEHEKTKQDDAADFLSSCNDYIKLLNAKRK